MQVSVSITTYNHERFIEQAINSVLMQRGDFAYEIIIGDDCSTDGSSRIIDDMQRAYPELIRVIRPPRNLGDKGRPVFLETVKAAKGRYIAILDGDDYWTNENKLATQVALMEADSACTMTYHNAIRVFADGSEPVLFNSLDHPSILTTEKLLEGNWVPGCSPVVRADLLSGLPAWFYAAPWADWPLYLFATETGTVRYINEVFGAYRVHPGGAWSGLTEEVQAAELVKFFEMLHPHFRARYGSKINESLAFRRGQLLAAQSRRPAAK